MKHNKIAVTIMCLLALAVCANAQSAAKKPAKTDGAKLEKVLQARALQAKQAQKAKCHKCGEIIYDKYHQECAQGGHCEQFPQTADQPVVYANPYFKGGDPHNADNYVKGHAPAELSETDLIELEEAVQHDRDTSSDGRAHCAACGEEIHSAGQHCSASGYTTLCSPVKEQAVQKTSSDEPVYIGGDPHNPDNWVKPVKKQVKKQAKPVCAECGEEIHSAGQHCSASGYTTLCSSVKETKKETRVENTYKGGDPHANETH